MIVPLHSMKIKSSNQIKTLFMFEHPKFRARGPSVLSLHVILKLNCVPSDLEHLLECRFRSCALRSWA